MVTNISRAELQLLRGRLRPLFLRYAVPGVVSMLFLALQSVADGIIVGRLINATAWEVVITYGRKSPCTVVSWA